MANEELIRLVNLSADFKKAVEGSKLAKDPENQKKAMESLKPGELEKIEGLLQEIVTETFGYAFGGEPSESFLKKNLTLCEITADLFLRVAPAKEIAAFVPAELKNQKDADALRAAGAPKLASLCA